MFLLVLLHAIAMVFLPGQLWGVSHLVVWPKLWVLTAVAATIALLLWSMSTHFPLREIPFLDRKKALLLALLAGAVFWFLSETHHFFGDGYHIIRSRGMSVTFLRAPILVRSTVSIVRGLESHGVPIETGMRGLSILAGMVSVYLLCRLVRVLADRDDRRWFLFAVLVTAGSMQLFFGHTEYYGMLAVPVLFYLLLATKALRGGTSSWRAAFFFPLLPGLHLSALGLVPMHAYVLWKAWQRRDRIKTLVGFVLGLGVAWFVLRLVRIETLDLAGQVTSGLRGYTAPYFDKGSTRHAFTLLSPQHLWALLNDFLLVAPLAFVLLPFALKSKQEKATAWGWAALGCMCVNVLFNREIGVYRDWDTLAPYAFVYLIWLALRSANSFAGQELKRVTAALFVVGLFHLSSWTLLNTNMRAAEKHFRIALTQKSLWSRYARSYIHEEFAIHYRNAGDLQTALREYNLASRATPTDARYQLGVGNIALQLGNWEAAIVAYERALEHRPDYLPAHSNLASALASVGRDLDKAEWHARRAVELDQSNDEAWMTYSDVALRRNDIPAAIHACQQVLRLKPDHVEARQRLQDLTEPVGQP